MFELRGASTCHYRPHRVWLDSNVQPSMLGKVVVDGLGLTNVDFSIHGWVRESEKVNQIGDCGPC